MAGEIELALKAIDVGIKVFGLFQGRDSSEDAIRAAQDAARGNADDLLALANTNSGIISGVAAYNANNVLTIGYANASAIERNMTWNVDLMGLQAYETLRRHVREEKYVAGTIRAGYGASGISVNVGTPLHYLNDQIEEGITQRRYLGEVFKKTILGYIQTESDRAALQRLEADLTAAGLEFEASMSINALIAEAQAAANRELRDAQLRVSAAGAISDSALIRDLIIVGESVYDIYDSFPSEDEDAGITPAGQV